MEGANIYNPAKKSVVFVLASSGILVGWSWLSSILVWGPVSASIITYLLYASYWLYVLIQKDALILRLLLIGTVAGILELATDDYLVHGIDSLVYPSKELMIWSSPAYMPLAWSNVILQLGFIGVLLTRKLHLILASIVLGIAGGMYIPLYEHLAKDAGWWWYHANTRMVFNAPLYVIICEALISLALPAAVYYASRLTANRSLIIGFLLGIWIYVSALIAFNLVH
ncbi:DUF6989 domain-containing protein [Reichenbachiella ulvae]|uniref:DUF6989 domain-containing protein n=1 Tax=Reichenbachiella ulvae TaxID=2980104 RepID=A0ABT3CSS4_9BACT|nr:hypothetical protein [Reichenbachiella ulvae]MCV9386520.1 hypothetical protein [Reichenbachiella ulvae]